MVTKHSFESRLSLCEIRKEFSASIRSLLDARLKYAGIVVKFQLIRDSLWVDVEEEWSKLSRRSCPLSSLAPSAVRKPYVSSYLKAQDPPLSSVDPAD